MAEAKAAAVASTLLSFGGPAGALIGGIVGGLLGKEKVPDTVPLQYAVTQSDLDPKDFKYYVQAQLNSAQRQADATRDELNRRQEIAYAQIRETQMGSEMSMAQAKYDQERKQLEQQAELQRQQDEKAAKARRTTSQQAPIYKQVDVTEQLIPVLTNQALTSIPASPVAAAITPSNVMSAPASSAGISSYLPIIIGGALILSLVLTGRKGRS